MNTTHQCQLSDVTENGCEPPTSDSESPPIQGWFEGAYTGSGRGGYGYVIKKGDDEIVEGGSINFDDRNHTYTRKERDYERELFVARFEGLINATKCVDRVFDEPEVEFFGISPYMIGIGNGKKARDAEYVRYQNRFHDLQFIDTDIGSIRLKTIDIDDYADFSDTPSEYDRAQEIAYENSR